RQHLVEICKRKYLRDTGRRTADRAVRTEHAAAERGSADGCLPPDLAETDDPDRQSTHFAMQRTIHDTAVAPRSAAKACSDVEIAMRPDQHRHNSVFGHRHFMAVGVADRDPWRQLCRFDPVGPGDRQLQQFEPRRRGHSGSPGLADDDVDLAERGGDALQVAIVCQDFGLDIAFDDRRDPLDLRGREAAEEQDFHAATVCFFRKSSRTVMPSPGRSGTSIIPSLTRKSSSTRSCNSGLAPREYSTMKPAGEAAATCSPAAKAGAPAHRCGASFRLCALAKAEMRIASVIPPQIARSGCMISTAPSTARSRKSCRVNSLSPEAIGMSVRARTSACPRLSSAVTG